MNKIDCFVLFRKELSLAGVRLPTMDHGETRPLSMEHLGSDGRTRAHTDTSQRARGLTAKRFCTSRGAVRGVLAVRRHEFGVAPPRIGSPREGAAQRWEEKRMERPQLLHGGGRGDETAEDFNQGEE